MNQSEKEILPLRVAVNVNPACAVLVATVVGGPVGLVLGLAGVAGLYTGNRWMNEEAERMERERARGETPKRPDTWVLDIPHIR